MDGKQLRRRRVAEGIPGYVVCGRANIARSRLSDIELGHVEPSDEELKRIGSAIEGILAEKEKITQLAAENGLALTGIRL